jgi:adenylate kinase
MEPETHPVLNRFFEARLRQGDVANGMILDGYPTTNDHANFASKLVEAGVMPKPVILHLLIADEVVRKRLGGRDGNLSASAEQRLKDYHRETVALRIYFPDADITDIDGTRGIRTVTKRVEAVLKDRFSRRSK